MPDGGFDDGFADGFDGMTCQYHLRTPAAAAFTERNAAASGGSGGDSVFPGLPWMPSGDGSGSGFTARTAAAAGFTARPAAEGTGTAC